MNKYEVILSANAALVIEGDSLETGSNGTAIIVNNPNNPKREIVAVIPISALVKKKNILT